MSTKKTLQTCPDEIVLGVIDELRMPSTLSPNPKLDLCSLSLCSKYFNSLVEPKLYSFFKVDANSNRYVLVKFLRTLLERNSLGRYVEWLDLDPPWFNQVQMISSDDYNKDLISRIEAIVAVLDPDQTIPDRSPKSLLVGRQWDLVVALLLYLCPNVDGASLMGIARNQNYHSFTDIVLRKAMNVNNIGALSLPILQKLETLILGPRFQDEEPMSLDTIIPYICVPSVIRVSCLNIWERSRPNLPGAASFSPLSKDERLAASNLKILSFSQSRLPTNVMKPFFTLFPKLETLSYVLCTQDPADDEFDPAEFSDAIAHLEESLVILSVTRTQSMDLREMDVQGLGPLVSLSGFKKLKHLESTATVLIGRIVDADPEEYHIRKYFDTQIQDFVNALPASLAKLAIWDCTDSIFDVLPVLLHSTNCPELWEVHIFFNEEWYEEYYVERPGLHLAQLEADFLSMRNIELILDLDAGMSVDGEEEGFEEEGFEEEGFEEEEFEEEEFEEGVGEDANM